jgi:hypothetical protein
MWTMAFQTALMASVLAMLGSLINLGNTKKIVAQWDFRGLTSRKA